jgi:hypothetical protein
LGLFALLPLCPALLFIPLLPLNPGARYILACASCVLADNLSTLYHYLIITIPLILLILLKLSLC